MYILNALLYCIYQELFSNQNRVVSVLWGLCQAVYRKMWNYSNLLFAGNVSSFLLLEYHGNACKKRL